MPGLRPKCLQTMSSGEEYCCTCEENECSILLSPRGDTILFADGDEVITTGNSCDCIIVLKRGNMIEVYAIELKKISKVDKRSILIVSGLKQKWENCLKWALDIVKGFKSVEQKGFNICVYVVLVVPDIVRQSIFSLIKQEISKCIPNLTVSIGRIRISGIQGRILSCNTPIIGHADIFFSIFLDRKHPCISKSS